MLQLSPLMAVLTCIAVFSFSFVIGFLIAGRRQQGVVFALEQRQKECQSLQQMVQDQQHKFETLKHASDSEIAKRHELDIAHGRIQQQLELQTQTMLRRESELKTQIETLSQDIQHIRQQLDLTKSQYAEQTTLLRSAEINLDQQVLRYNELQLQAQSWSEKNDRLQQQLLLLSQEHTQLKATLEEREQSYQKQLKQFDFQKKALSDEFKVLANDILESKSKAMQDNAKVSVSSLMTPFQKSIEEFKKEVQEIHHRETTQQGELRKELQSLKELNEKITHEAHELSTALRGQKKLQGNWGELVLENVLDRSGLVVGTDYDREVSYTTEEGRQRPDVVVYLPQSKHLVIDAKVSLNAYTRYINAEDDVTRAQALKEHVKAVGHRIDELAARDYYKLPGLNSPEIVFMFIPIESAFVEALKADETLFTRAIENNVLVATPTTLLTSLNIVRQLWRYEDQNKHTAALAGKAEQVFKKLNNFLTSFLKVKQSLGKATEAYEQAESQLLSGKGNLVKQVSHFRDLAPAIKQELPSYFTEKADLEIELVNMQIDILPESKADKADRNCNKKKLEREDSHDR